jgi:signal transduction histidine kinase
VRPVAEKGNVTLATFGPGDGLEIQADGVKLGQVLYNLLGNAIKFSPPQSTVDVTVLREETRGDGAGHVRISVRDRGIGIAAADHEIIFEKFRQLQAGATRAYGGTGLGLAISKSLVELHAGTIWVESAPGGGSVFHVRLPVAGAGKRALETREAPTTVASAGSAAPGALAPR